MDWQPEATELFTELISLVPEPRRGYMANDVWRKAEMLAVNQGSTVVGREELVAAYLRTIHPDLKVAAERHLEERGINIRLWDRYTLA